ncbi:MAG TPA: hypothetical protein VGO02_12570 [Burkholderiales bacterium]|nr:hypothetical protein [Burkholderiales bacterium]
MLKMFGGGGSDHPMADAKEAKRLLDGLPAQDAKALEELAGWLESVSAAQMKADLRIQRLLAIDEVAQARVRKLARDVLVPSPQVSRFQDNVNWTRLHDYWRHAGLAFARCIDSFLQGAKGAEAAKTLLPLTVARALRCLGQQMKWQLVRYAPADVAIWGVLNKIYAFAELRGITEARVNLYPAGGIESTPRLEFLKVCMMGAASPDSLLPLEVEVAERAIGDLAPSFALAAQPERELLYWTDLALATAPLRSLREPKPAQGLRFFGPGSAVAALAALIRKMQTTREVPASLSLGGSYDPEVVLSALEHLAVYWDREPPERRHPRHSVKSRLTVTHGFNGVLEALGGNGGSLDFNPAAAENWTVENVSAGGFGVLARQVKSDWLKVGTLLAMQPDGGPNWVVGAVRRVTRLSKDEARIGIETLSRAPAVSSFSAGAEAQPGVLLAAAPETGETSIALRAGVFIRGCNLETAVDGRHHVYMPQTVDERGDDYEIARFREMIRES